MQALDESDNEQMETHPTKENVGTWGDHNGVNLVFTCDIKIHLIEKKICFQQSSVQHADYLRRCRMSTNFGNNVYDTLLHLKKYIYIFHSD